MAESRRVERWAWGAVMALALVVALLTFFDVNGYETSDPQLSLLVSQAILEQGTVKLDVYAARTEPPLDDYSTSGPLSVIDGHYYYYFPLGSAVLAVPAVAVANWAGLDMALQADNRLLQELLSCAICALAVPLLYALCRCFVDPLSGVAITAVSMLGSGLISTLGTAYWGIDPAVLCVLLALGMLARHQVGRARWGNPYLLGVLLFLAYFCRASAAAFILAALAYLLWRDRLALVKAAGTAALCLAVFLLFSRYEYGSFFPQYYSLGRFQAYTIPVWTAAWLHLFSPSRGLLLLSPFLLLTVVACCRTLKQLGHDALFWTSLGWVALQVFAASRSTRWWGGHTFGSRILVEIVPALVLWTAMAWRAMAQAGRGSKRLWASAYLLLGVVSMVVHSYQGLYNLDTGAWNGAALPPDVDSHPEYLLDWRYPQYAASRPALCQRNRAYMLDSLQQPIPLAPYSFGTAITYQSGLADLIPAERGAYLENWALPHGGEVGEEIDLAQIVLQQRLPFQGNAVFIGWSSAEAGYCWSQCEAASVLFWLAETAPQSSYRLVLEVSAYGSQRVEVFVNDHVVGELWLEGGPLPFAPTELSVAGDWLRPQAYNEIRFGLPDAVRPTETDARLLGLAFSSLMLVEGD